MMERQIGRIEAHKDMRGVNVGMSVQSSEATNKTMERLKLEVGETFEFEGPRFVKADDDAHKKMSRLMG